MISNSMEQSINNETVRQENFDNQGGIDLSQTVITSKAQIVEDSLSKYFTEKYNFNNSPTEYAALKAEAKYLSEMTNYMFLLLAHRLINIRDGKLYEQQEYRDFSAFLDKELTIPRTVVGNYIDLLNCFGVETFEKDREAEPAKLIPAIPLLKSKKTEGNKKEIKENFIAKSKSHTAKEMKQEADFFKREYNLKTEREPNIIAIVSSFLKKIPKELSEQHIEELKSLTDQQKEDLKFIAEQFALL